MSDQEAVSAPPRDYRDLPAVPAVPRPQRLSQTFLRHADHCLRSAYLLLRHGGGVGPQLDFGTAGHLFAERAMLELIRNGEKNLYAAAEGEDPAAAQREVASLTAAMVDEVLREHPELSVTAAGADDLREVAYHWAVAQDVDPQTVLGVERKFVLDLECGWTISGKIDLAAFRTPEFIEVTDYKLTWALPSQADFEDGMPGFQCRLYALLLAFGNPVEVVDGEEVRLPGVSDGVNFFRAREVYPRYLKKDGGGLQERALMMSRTELAEFRADVERLAERVTGALESGKWPAVPGAHCSQCPCVAECPLPDHLRNHAGEINAPGEAAEAAEWLERTKDETSALQKELRRFATAHGPVRYGRDRVLEFVLQESRRVDVEGLVEAARRAAAYGDLLDPDEFVKVSPSTVFKARTLTADELAESRDWGDVPF